MDASLSGVNTRAREWTSQFTLINNLTNETTSGFFEQLICCEAKSPTTRNRDDDSQPTADEPNALQSSQSSSGDSNSAAEDVSASQEDESNDSQDDEEATADPNAVIAQSPVLTVETVVETTPSKTVGETESDNVESPANHLDFDQAAAADSVQATSAVEGNATEQSPASSSEVVAPENENLDLEAPPAEQQIAAEIAPIVEVSTAIEASDVQTAAAAEDVVLANAPQLEGTESVASDSITSPIAQTETNGNASNLDQSNSRDNQGTQSSRDRNSTRRGRWFERDASSRQDGLAGANGNVPQKVAASDAQSADKVASDSLASSANALQGAIATGPTAELPPPVVVDPASVVPTPAVSLATPAVATAADVLEISAAQGAGTNEGTIGSTTPIDSNRPSARSDATTAANDAKANANVNDPTNLSQMERVRLVQRVSRSFSRLGPTGGEINLKLHPPQLGSLNVQVRLEGRSLTAKLTTESVAAQEALMENLPVLRSRLAEQGFEISQFQVDVADSGNMNSTFGGDQGQRNDFQQAREELDRTVSMRRIHNDRRSMPAAVPVALESQPMAWRAEQGSGIDVRA